MDVLCPCRVVRFLPSYVSSLFQYPQEVVSSVANWFSIHFMDVSEMVCECLPPAQRLCAPSPWTCRDFSDLGLSISLLISVPLPLNATFTLWPLNGWNDNDSNIFKFLIWLNSTIICFNNLLLSLRLIQTVKFFLKLNDLHIQKFQT